MRIAVKPQIPAPAPPGRFAWIKIRSPATPGAQAGARQPLDLRQDFQFIGGINKAAQGWWLVVCGQQETHQAAIGNRNALHTELAIMLQDIDFPQFQIEKPTRFF